MSVEGWKNNSLISLLKILKSGGTPNTSQSNFYGGDIPFVAIEDMSASRKYLCSTVKSLTKEGIKNSNAWLVPQNSLLYSIYATLGLVRINTIPVATNQAILAMIVNDEMVDQDYLYYWLEYIRDSVVNLSAQTTQSNLSATTVKPFVVQHPQNKQEQTQIATILSTIDRAIEQTEALIAKQQRIKTGLMQDLLTKGIDENGNIRSEETHEFKDSPLGRIPVEWDCKDIITIAYVTKLAGFEFTNYFNYSIGGEIIALRALNIKNEKLDLTDIQTIPKKVSDILPRSKINRNDILITYIGAYIGDVLRIEDNEKFHLAPNIAKIVSKDGVYPQFLEIALRTHYLQRQIKNLTATTATPSLTMTQIRSLLVAIPRNQSEQKVITEHISRITKVIDENASRLAKLKLQKTGLMQDLLTGKVRVIDLLNQKTAAN